MRYYKHLLLTTLLACGFNASALQLYSTNLTPNTMLTNAQVFNGFGCTGLNQSPQLSWKDAPKDTKSFAITVYDPDAPTGSGWWHWTVFNIPNTVSQLEANASSINALPSQAIQGRTDFGISAFGGACPPKGDKAHRYQFTVWALKVDALPLDAQASGALVGYYLNANKLEKSSITLKYAR